MHLVLVAMLAATAEAGVSAGEKKQMLHFYNKYRCLAGSKPLTWDTALAKAAQSWADTGSTSHSTSLGAFKKYGENMQYACPKSTPEDATTWWYDEIKKYTPDSPYQATHYTQMVWKGTEKFGCGKGKAPCGGDMWVCQFKPMGNMYGKYKDNVKAPTAATKASCGSSTLYSSNVPNVGFAQGSAMLGAAAFFAVTAFFTVAVAAGFRLRQGQARRAAALAAHEGLELDPFVAGEEGFCPE
jgi:hypothetical protein